MGRGKVRLCIDEPGSIEIQVGSYYEVFTYEEALEFATKILETVPKAIKAERMHHAS